MTPTRRRARLAATVFLALTWVCLSATSQSRPQSPAPPAAPADPQQLFRGGTVLVPVDVRVIDRAGKPVTDLTQDEFFVTENGARQPIRHFAVQNFTPEAPGPADVLKARTTVNDRDKIDPENRRVFLIVLGRGRLQPPAKGVDGLIHFVQERLLPQDLVAVIAWDRATEFTSDHGRIVGLLERFKKTHEGIESRLHLMFSGLAAVYGSKEMPKDLQRDVDAVFGGAAAGLGVRSTTPSEGPSNERLAGDRQNLINALHDATLESPLSGANLALEDYVAADAASMQDLGKLYAGIEYLRHFDGEKHLIFESESGLVLPRSEDDRDLAALAADARVSIDYIHTSGVQTAGVSFDLSGFSAARGGVPVSNSRGFTARGVPIFTPMGWQLTTARTIASTTGGRLYTGRYATDELNDIDAISRFEYILGYYPANPALDGKYRQIRVSVRRPGLTVLYRHGYFASPPSTPLDRRQMLTYSRVAAAAGYPNAVPDIGLKVTATASKLPAEAGVAFGITLNPTHLSFSKTNGRNVTSLELLVASLDDRDNLLGEMWKHVDLTYTDDRLAAVKQSGVPMSLILPLDGPAASAKTAKVVVYDYAADLAGTAIVKVK